MKGIVFTEFLDLVEDNFGYEKVDKIIKSSQLPSHGVYTAVGTYPHTELMGLVKELSNETGISTDNLQRMYGKHLFGALMKTYMTHFTDISALNCFGFLESIQHHIHAEVLKLYPEAELPQFDTIKKDAHTLEMVYTSERKMADFAVGLIEACLLYFNEKGTVEKYNLNDDGSKVKLIIKKNSDD